MHNDREQCSTKEYPGECIDCKSVIKYVNLMFMLLPHIFAFHACGFAELSLKSFREK